MRRSCGNHHAQVAATAMVAIPPNTTARTVPNQAAVSYYLLLPSSFDAPMNTAFTALTRPRISSGVSSCTSR